MWSLFRETGGKNPKGAGEDRLSKETGIHVHQQERCSAMCLCLNPFRGMFIFSTTNLTLNCLILHIELIPGFSLSTF